LGIKSWKKIWKRTLVNNTGCSHKHSFIAYGIAFFTGRNIARNNALPYGTLLHDTLGSLFKNYEKWSNNDILKTETFWMDFNLFQVF
jgi:hypothetical protein